MLAAAPTPPPPSLTDAVHGMRPLDDVLTSLIPVSSHPSATSATLPQTYHYSYPSAEPWSNQLAAISSNTNHDNTSLLPFTLKPNGLRMSGSGQFQAMEGINSALPESIRTVPSQPLAAGSGDRTRYRICRNGSDDGGDDAEESSAQRQIVNCQARRYNT